MQAVLERTPPDERDPVTKALVPGAGLPKVVRVALNTHGTRAVQKLVETLRLPEQAALATAALCPGVVALIKDLNGNHVVQRCLQRLSAEDAQFIYDAAGAHCVEIATHRHGCCVMQRCVDHATEALCSGAGTAPRRTRAREPPAQRKYGVGFTYFFLKD